MPDHSGTTSITSGPAGPAKRACDACHRRKVKCIVDGPPNQPCKNCSHAGLKCTFNAPVQKKGPKGCRAKVISELRETQRKTIFAPPHAAAAALSASPPHSPAFPRPALTPLPPDLIQCCINYFFTHMWPTQPILDRQRLQLKVANMLASPDDYCLVVALCAYMMIQPNMSLPPTIALSELNIPNLYTADVSSNIVIGSTFLASALEIRKSCAHFEHPTADAVLISFFLFGCYFCLEKHNTAWFQLREATTLALLLSMHQESSYAIPPCDPLESTLKRRLFWQLFVTERAYALQTQKPLTLHDTIALPSVKIDGRESPELVGFVHLIMLFKPFDDAFVGLWNQSLDSCNPEWIAMLHKQLSDALPAYLRSTETQAVDLRTSQQWLRVMVWQLSISHKLLSSTASDSALTFKYPLELSRELIANAQTFSQESMEVHGIGLVKKLFDVACTLIDVMTCVPFEPTSFEIGPRDYLQQFVQIMGRLRGGQSRYLPMLLSKMNEAMSQGVPGMLLPGPPSNAPSNDDYGPGSSDSQSPEHLAAATPSRVAVTAAIMYDSSSSSSRAGSVGTPAGLKSEFNDTFAATSGPYATPMRATAGGVFSLNGGPLDGMYSR